MTEAIEVSKDAAMEDLGRLLGRREAFAVMAGGCSAAEALSLRRIRDTRLYRNLGLTWEEFCAKRLGSSRRNVERTLRLLDEFGPAYFHVAQMAHVTPEEYRAIAAHVGEEGVRVDGAVIALLPENAEAVSTAVGELLRREKPQPAKPAAPPVEAAVKRCDALRESIEAFGGPLEEVHRLGLATALLRLVQTARGRGIWLLP